MFNCSWGGQTPQTIGQAYGHTPRVPREFNHGDEGLGVEGRALMFLDAYDRATKQGRT